MSNSGINGLTLFIRFEGSGSQSIELPSTATLADLRRAVAETSPLAPEGSPLLFAGVELKGDGAPLSDLGIGQESTIDVRRMLVYDLEDEEQRARLIKIVRSNELGTAEFEISYMSDQGPTEITGNFGDWKELDLDGILVRPRAATAAAATDIFIKNEKEKCYLL